jgi:hypothetical protein
MTYKIGTRVRHVTMPGTGVVAEIDPFDEFGMTVGVRMDNAGIAWIDTGALEPHSAGEVCFDYPHRWIPIVDLHEPAEQELTESLDKLLSEVIREAV